MIATRKHIHILGFDPREHPQRSRQLRNIQKYIHFVVWQNPNTQSHSENTRRNKRYLIECPIIKPTFPTPQKSIIYNWLNRIETPHSAASQLQLPATFTIKRVCGKSCKFTKITNHQPAATQRLPQLGTFRNISTKSGKLILVNSSRTHTHTYKI